MTEPQVRIWREGSAGRIRLNRPAALNAITLEMVREMDRALTAWQDDRDVACIILDGEGPRGLCAGGDIRALYDSGKRGDGEAARFWFEEYRLNARIAGYPKPYVAFMDGIVMGGGVGVSAHASHRVVTETTVLAMPEVGIGFIPDVGGTWLLAHAPGDFGTYIGFTGDRVGAADAIVAGFADVMVPRAQLPELAAALSALAPDAGSGAVSELLARFAAEVASGPLTMQREAIDALFAFRSAEEILAALDAAGTEFATKAAATLRKKSPTSLKLALQAIRAAKQLDSLEQALIVEYRAALRLLEGADFYEGVGATVINKGQTPQWQPPTLEQVTEAIVQRHFAPLGEHDLHFD